LDDSVNVVWVAERDKTKTATAACLRILHHYTVNHVTKPREISKESVLGCFPAETPNKQFSLLLVLVPVMLPPSPVSSSILLRLGCTRSKRHHLEHGKITQKQAFLCTPSRIRAGFRPLRSLISLLNPRFTLKLSVFNLGFSVNAM